MQTSEDLHLYEEVLLLALGDRAGTITSGTWYRQALSGALLAELVLAGSLKLGADGKTLTGSKAAREATGDPLPPGVPRAHSKGEQAQVATTLDVEGLELEGSSAPRRPGALLAGHSEGGTRRRS